MLLPPLWNSLFRRRRDYRRALQVSGSHGQSVSCSRVESAVATNPSAAGAVDSGDVRNSGGKSSAFDVVAVAVVRYGELECDEIGGEDGEKEHYRHCCH